MAYNRKTNTDAPATQRTTRSSASSTRTPRAKTTRVSRAPRAQASKLKVIPIGGLHEVGKNITAFEYEDEILIVDCGVAFPEDDMLGIDLVIPDFSYLVKNKDKILGIVLTHGHEDHIGSLPYFLREVNVPVYGTRLTIGLVETKLREHNLLNSVERVNVNAGDTIKLGKHFKVEFIRSNHSIADSVALAITTPAGVVIHSGDFKVDYTPVQGEPIDLQKIAEYGKKGVLLFMCESTNVERPGYTMSESTIGKIFEEIFDNAAEQRIMVATFSSNIDRIQQIINCAQARDRKVCVVGRSMTNVVKAACELGYINYKEGTFIEPNELKNYDDHRLVIITTGSQGETMSALSRMANNEHKLIEIKPGDKIIISASPIPGNEKNVSHVINELLKKGADVIYDGLMDVHVSGHARQEEIKLLHALIKPKYFMPIHGEYKMLTTHKNLAMSMGMKKENIFVMANGDVLELNNRGAKLNPQAVTSGQVFVDGLGVGDVGNIVLRDRRHLSQDGLMIVVVVMDSYNGGILRGPDIISRGFVYVRESEELITEARDAVRQALEECDLHSGSSEWSYYKTVIKDTLRDYLWKKTKRSPMILPIIMPVEM